MGTSSKGMLNILVLKFASNAENIENSTRVQV